MDNKDRYILSRLPLVETPLDLLLRVLHAIDLAELRRLRLRLSIAFAGLVVCLVSVAAYWTSLWSSVSASSFTGYARLILSDPDVVLANSREMFLALVESIPVDFLSALFISLFFLLATLGLGQTLVGLRRRAFIQNGAPVLH